MDNKLRNLERQATTGDTQAQLQLDEHRLRMGQAPSWEYLLTSYQQTKELLQQHLFAAVERELAAYFAKHGTVISEISWSNQHRPDFGCDAFEVEGLILQANEVYWDEIIFFSPDNCLDFEGGILISHLNGVCNCFIGVSGNTAPNCWIGDFDWINEQQQEKFLHSLTDADKLFQLLSRTQLDWIQVGKYNFQYTAKDGFKAVDESC